MIPTAKEILEKNEYLVRVETDSSLIKSPYIRAMIEFAKFHCEAQAKEIYNKGLDGLVKWDGNPYTGEGSDYLDRDSIINAYPLTLIK